MSQDGLNTGHATTPGVSSQGKQAAHLIMELEYEDRAIWIAVLASGVGLLAGGQTASQFVVSQIYQGLTQSTQPIHLRMREAIDLANRELLHGRISDPDKPVLAAAALIAAIDQQVLRVSYVGDLVAYAWIEGLTYPISGNHPQFASSAGTSVINSADRLGQVPDVAIHSLVLDPRVQATISHDSQKQLGVKEEMVCRENTLLILSSGEISTQMIGDTIAYTSSAADPGVIANGIVTRPEVVGGPNDATAIVLRTELSSAKRSLIDARILYPIMAMFLFVAAVSGMIIGYPELASQWHIIAPPVARSGVDNTVAHDKIGIVANDSVEKGSDLVTSNDATLPLTETVKSSVVMTQAALTITPVVAPPSVAQSEDTGDNRDLWNATSTPVAWATWTSTPTTEPTFTPTKTVNPTARPTLTLTTESIASVTRELVAGRATSPATLASLPGTSSTARLQIIIPTSTSTGTATATATRTRTPSPTFTATSSPTNTPTQRPSSTSTQTPLPSAVPATADVAPQRVAGDFKLLNPANGFRSNGRQFFEWSFQGSLADFQKFEVVLWEDGQQPLQHAFGIAPPTKNHRISVNFDALSQQLPIFKAGTTYNWGILVVSENPYTRLQYLGGGWRFSYAPASSSNGSDRPGE